MDSTIYGADRCHKTQHYIRFFKDHNIDFVFLDVEKNDTYAAALRSLYTNGKLNFPTITLDHKKLRNPSDAELLKWIDILT
ncbi:glutaredoxin domain-containing protein [Flavobacteriaceae bacterium S356]|uniref:Glutaredoxin domain-containing protein n=1 Tax=Asprobacillus argus TaxID=3076534 RepID=A0ABU3LB71_9FLAO|nr:glutaredoxin domain-containing protein [Flavobacteriaceae bacterium S356]